MFVTPVMTAELMYEQKLEMQANQEVVIRIQWLGKFVIWPWFKSGALNLFMVMANMENGL